MSGRVCSKCKLELPVADFHKDRTKKDGFCATCKSCVLVRMRAKYEANTEKMREKSRKYREQNPDKIRQMSANYRSENKEKTLLATQKWRDENPELVRELAAKYYASADKDVMRKRNSEWYRANIDRVREQHRSWCRANANRVAAIRAARRARKANAEGRYTPDQISALLATQKRKCAVCRARLGKSFHRDHIVPLVRGGTNYITNIQLLCGPCNISKGSKDPVEFMQRRGFLL